MPLWWPIVEGSLDGLQLGQRKSIEREINSKLFYEYLQENVKVTMSAEKGKLVDSTGQNGMI